METDRTIAITGSTGFIGFHLVNSLANKQFRIIDISRKAGFDIRHWEQLEKVPRFDAMVHLAAEIYVPESYRERLSFYHTNVTGTLHCLELCKRYNAKIIFTSSYVYGQPEYFPIDERHPVACWNPYATSKVIGEQLCSAYTRDFGIPSCIFRIFNAFGKGQDRRLLIPTIIEGIRKGKISLDNLSTKRDYIYVLDIVEAVEKCLSLEWEGVKTYNIGSGVSVSVVELVAIIKDILKSNADLNSRDLTRKVDIDNVVADISKARNELGWNPKYNLKTGLKHYLSKTNNRNP